MYLDDSFPSPAELSPAEQVIYQMVYEAAENGNPCPLNMDLEDAAGFNSTSMGTTIIQRLQKKGLIRVVSTGQKFRRVQIVSSGKWTGNDPRQRKIGVHVPRGARRAVATDRKPYKGV